MDFSFTDEQSMLRDTVASYLADHYSFDQRHALLAKEPGWSPAVWKAFAEELGILGAPFSEELGGLGGGPIENMIVMQEMGRALVVEPYLGTVVIGGGFLKHSGYAGAEALIGQIIAGETIFAFAYAEPQGRYNLADLKTTAKKDGSGWVLNGAKAVVIGGPYASHFIVTARTGGGQRDQDGVSVFIVEKGAAGVSTRDYPTVDGFRASEVIFENVKLGADALVGPEGQAMPLIEKVVDEAVVATCGEACGVLAKLHEGTLEYTKQRKQFGQPISAFQVLQHRMVDCFTNAQEARSMTLMASLKIEDKDPIVRHKAASGAKVQIGKSGKFCGQSAVQMHGGMGVTDELSVSHYFKRLTMIDLMFGNQQHHLTRYSNLAMAA